jgi:hypothetical protein
VTIPSLYCKKCGKALAPGATFCKYCGAPLPSAASPSARPALAPPTPAKTDTHSCFLVGFGIVAGACLFLALLAVILIGLRRLKPTSITLIPTPSPVPTNPPAAASITPQPTKTHLPPTRTAAAPTKSPTKASPSKTPVLPFSDDFTNPGSGWKILSNADFTLGYTVDHLYVIGVKQPKQSNYAIPPYSFTKPLKNYSITLHGKTAISGMGAFGVLCDYQDDQNYYRVAISGIQYSIGKMVKGKYTQLTSPYWKELINERADVNGYYQVGVSCFDGTIVLQVGDTGQAHLTDADLTSGDAALFAESGAAPDDNGYYVRALFKDITIALLK